jgi:hypothetical protein
LTFSVSPLDTAGEDGTNGDSEAMFELAVFEIDVSFGKSVASFTSIETAIPVSITIFFHGEHTNWHFARSRTVR